MEEKDCAGNRAGVFSHERGTHENRNTSAIRHHEGGLFRPRAGSYEPEGLMNRRRQGLPGLLVDHAKQLVDTLAACLGRRYTSDSLAGAIEVCDDGVIVRDEKPVRDTGQDDLEPKGMPPLCRPCLLALGEFFLVLGYELAGALFAPSKAAVIPPLHLDDDGNYRAFSDEGKADQSSC
jgi:hypothetical protein